MRNEVVGARRGETLGGMKPAPAAAPRRRQRPKGLPRLWTRVRRLLWSWWLWAALAVLALLLDRSYTALGLAVAAVVIYMVAPRERAPTYGLDHDFEIESEEFLNTVVGATGTPFLAGNSMRRLQQRRRVLPGDAGGRGRRVGLHHDRGVHLLGRRHREPLRQGVRGQGPRRAPRQNTA